MASVTEEIKGKLLQAIALAEHKISQAKFKVKDRLHLLEPLKILPYYGFGNEHYVYLKGRVLENEGIREDEKSEDTITHLKNTFKRYESDEIPGICVQATFAGQQKEVLTDEEGYFEFEFKSDKPIDYLRWGTNIKLTLQERKTAQDEIEAYGEVFALDKEVEFGIISDIDDTVLISDVTHFLGRLKLMLLKNAAHRSPFPGVAAFLQALCKGSDGQGQNPLFYVSGSEWNLFDLLVSFFRTHNIPQGPLLLRDKGNKLDKGKAETSEQEYKLVQIRHILDTYSHLKFICIGDSGQHDPEIYQRLVEQYPGRILGIYIRDVSPEKRDKEVQGIAHKLGEQGIQMLLAKETVTAAQHAVKMGWINQNQLEDIKRDCEKDDHGE